MEVETAGDREEGDVRFDRLYQLLSTTFPACDYSIHVSARLSSRDRKGLTSSFSMDASARRRTSSCASKENIGPDFPLYWLMIKSSTRSPLISTVLCEKRRKEKDVQKV
jgi:hypothetical protein